MNLLGNATFGRLDADGSGNITTGGDRKYYLTDHLGSTRAVVDANGDLKETRDYYPFGLAMPNRSWGEAEAMERFTGHEYDEDVGLELYYAGARYIDPALGQFTSVDPLADEFPAWSPYNYGMNNPNRFTDPTGMAGREVLSFGNADYGDVRPSEEKSDDCPECEDFWEELMSFANWVIDKGFNIKIDFTGDDEDIETSENENISIAEKQLAQSMAQGLIAYGNKVERMYEGMEYVPGLDITKSLYEGNYVEAAVDAAGLIPIGRGGKLFYGGFKSATKWANQLAKRGWNEKKIIEAVENGINFRAVNKVNKGNPATRYVHPQTGQSVVVDDVTKEVLHVGGPGFKY